MINAQSKDFLRLVARRKFSTSEEKRRLSQGNCLNLSEDRLIGTPFLGQLEC